MTDMPDKLDRLLAELAVAEAELKKRAKASDDARLAEQEASSRRFEAERAVKDYIDARKKVVAP